MPEELEDSMGTPAWSIGPWSWIGWRPHLLAIGVVAVAFMVLSRNLAAAEALVTVVVLLVALQLLLFATLAVRDRRILASAPEGTLVAGHCLVRPPSDSVSVRPPRNNVAGRWVPSSVFVTPNQLTVVPDQGGTGNRSDVPWTAVSRLNSAPAGGRTLHGAVSIVLVDGRQMRLEVTDYRRLAPVLQRTQNG